MKLAKRDVKSGRKLEQHKNFLYRDIKLVKELHECDCEEVYFAKLYSVKVQWIIYDNIWS